ncbi:hypothetical protein [Legionella drancourtii]|uniref:Uncharacterized protein n=1 Tax=Legionella drancourtii LLAP12 TaxID=658187 RepID=G9EKA2_9GAMM|nr:hypothetical protein [Legionella drancourtii]EHL32253.1 hypothetical protein LDG_5626 [Legionella drancourtii LLAP12]
MDKFIINMLLMFFFLLAQTAEATQQEAQELCVQKTVSRCLYQCQKTNIINCTQACPENAKNQCRQAGE